MTDRASSVKYSKSRHPSKNICRQKQLMAWVAVASRGSSICNVAAASRFANVAARGGRKRHASTCFVNQCTSRGYGLLPSLMHTPSCPPIPYYCDFESSIKYSSSTSLHMSTQASPQHTSAVESSSSPPKPKPKQTSPTKKKAPSTGLLRQLPPLSPHTEILSRATRQTYNTIRDDPKISNVKKRTQKRGSQTLDSLQQHLCRPLKETVETYRRLYRNMHPFERVVMDLTVMALQKKDGTTLSTLLEDVNECRKEVMELSKDWIVKIKGAESAREAYEFTEEGKESVGKVFDDLLGDCWSGMVDIQRALRKVPMVRLDCPAVVLVGAPNVGKSSIVRAISSGTPEVNNYPFTTRGMTLGHVQVFWESDADVAQGNVAGVSIPTEKDLVRENLKRKGINSKRMEMEDAAAMPSKKSFAVSQLCQIMDSPGLLRRDDGERRNEMEQLTLAAMSHLPTAVMFVMDLSGGAGDKCSSVEDQLILRKETRARFPRRPWIDVVSKVDLGIVDGAKERLMDILKEERLERAKIRGGEVESAEEDGRYFIELSIKEGQGVEELRQEVMCMLGEVRVVLDAMAAVDENSART